MNPVVVDQSALWSTVSNCTQGLVTDVTTAIVALVVIMFIVAAFDYLVEALGLSNSSKGKREMTDDESYQAYRKKQVRAATNKFNYEQEMSSMRSHNKPGSRDRGVSDNFRKDL